MRRPLAACALLLSLLSAGGCASRYRSWRDGRASPPERAPVETAAVPSVPRGPYALYRADGRPTTLAAVLADARRADVVLLGEVHEHPEGSRAEKEVLDGLLASSPRASSKPWALAMEFFERDTQAAVDAWAAGRMDEAELRKATKRSPSYERTHAPLLASARAARAPVIAANSPRRLVSAWRKVEGAEYAAWRASLPEADRALLPRAWSMPKDAYWNRFRDMMGPTAEGFFKSQTLWDDAMAEAVADARTARPDRGVLLVVGGFHVQGRLGTYTKLVQRRPGDRVLLIVMSESEGNDLAFEPGDRDLGDVVLKVPAATRDAAPGPNPHAVPPSPPSSPQPSPQRPPPPPPPTRPQP